MDSTTSASKQMNSNTSSKNRFTTRIISKVRALTVSESSLKPWIHLLNDDNLINPNRLTISLPDNRTRTKELYELDRCYDQDEEIDAIFAKEVKPLIPGVFDGQNATVITYGANGSGKTYVLQGSDNKKGLATMAMEEILLNADERGGSVAISVYEIYHDHIYDMLDSKKREISVLEDGKGNIQLKGLSQIPVKHVIDFQSLYFKEQKTNGIITDIGQRRHKGLMVHISSCGSNSSASSTSKMHFVDFSGYEDLTREFTGINLAEKNQNNKTLHAFHKVVQSLGVNQRHIPYRGSKLTRMLQDSLGRSNKILMITCLNPIHCHESISMLNLTSRTYESVHGAPNNSSRKPHLTSSCLSSSKSKKCQISGTVSKNSGHDSLFSNKKSNLSKSDLKSRNLFNEENGSTACVKEEVTSLYFASTLQRSSPSMYITTTSENFSSIDVIPKDVIPKDVTEMRNSCEEDCEETKSQVNDAETPPISVRLQELSNNLKYIYSTVPENLSARGLLSSSGDNKENIKLETPLLDRHHSRKEYPHIANLTSPFETFCIQSSEMKKSLSRDYIKFINSASKKELKELKGIGEKRASNILHLREQSPEHFKDLDDLREIGLSAKQIKGLMKDVAANIFS